MKSRQLTLILTLYAAILGGSTRAAPVINEIHYNNDINTVCNEFVELHNPDGVEVNLSNWKLTGAIEFTFPLGTILPPSSYFVVGENPATFTLDLITWTPASSLAIEVTSFPQAIGPFSQQTGQPKTFYRAKAIPPAE